MTPSRSRENPQQVDLEALKRAQEVLERTRFLSSGDSQRDYFGACDVLETALPAILAELEQGRRVREAARVLADEAIEHLTDCAAGAVQALVDATETLRAALAAEQPRPEEERQQG